MGRKKKPVPVVSAVAPENARRGTLTKARLLFPWRHVSGYFIAEEYATFLSHDAAKYFSRAAAPKGRGPVLKASISRPVKQATPAGPALRKVSRSQTVYTGEPAHTRGADNSNWR